jgi:hypothetical protein
LKKQKRNSAHSCDVGLPRAHACSLCPAGLARQLWLPVRSSTLVGPWVPPIGSVPPEPPAHTTRASSWTPRSRCTPRSRPLFLAAQCPTRSPPPAFAHLQHPRTRLAPRTHPGSFTAVRRGFGPVTRAPSRPRRVRCPAELRLDASNSGHPSVRPFPLYLSLRAHQTFTVQPKAIAVDPRLRRDPTTVQAPQSPLSR